MNDWFVVSSFYISLLFSWNDPDISLVYYLLDEKQNNIYLIWFCSTIIIDSENWIQLFSFSCMSFRVRDRRLVESWKPKMRKENTGYNNYPKFERCEEQFESIMTQFWILRLIMIMIKNRHTYDFSMSYHESKQTFLDLIQRRKKQFEAMNIRLRVYLQVATKILSPLPVWL